MALEELNEKLHGRDVHLHRGGNFTPYDPEHPVVTPETVEEFHETEKWDAKEGLTNPDLLLVGAHKKRRYLIAVGVSVLVLLLLIGGVIFKMRSSLFSEDKVSLSVAGPKNVASAEPVSFTVAYSNGNMTDMKDAVLIVTHPDTFRLEKSNEMKLSGQSIEIPLGDIAAKAKGEKIFTGKFYGSKGELGHFGATIRYTPNGFKSSFEKSAERYEVTIASSPLSLEVSAPQELVTGQEIDYVVEYRNQSDSSFSNLRLRMEYPEGFQFLNADPGTNEGEN
ncbi:MAG: hypothetical protein AAB708_02165, partial [Patescibacteria group bacterium]